MPVPDEVIFGPRLDGGSITYGGVRTVKDPNERIRLLRKRLNALFLGQVQKLKNNSAFPLTVMTCVGIETLGQIFVKKKESDQSYQFNEIAKKVDQRFGRKPDQKFMSAFEHLWPEKEADVIHSFGDLLYKNFRNTMIHSYRARGVYLSYEDTPNWLQKEGYIVINPDWLWDILVDKYNDLIGEAEQGEENSTTRENCLGYIQQLLD